MSFLLHSSVPGMAVPGMAVPALDGTGSGTQFRYLGHVPAFYLDYLDTFTQETLSAVPGGSYSMTPVNSRAGLTIPPPDHSWDPPDTFSFRLVLRPHHLALAAARAHSAQLHAALAATPPRPQGSRAGARTAAPPGPPSEAALALASARALNAEHQARRARGESVGC